MRKLILLVVLLTLVAFVSGAIAQQKPAPAKPATPPAPAPAPAPAKLEKFIGEVDKVDEMAKAVVVKGKVNKEEKSLAFATDDKTKITKAEKDMTLADLKKGMSVSVEYKKDGEKMTAVAIHVAAPKAAPKKAEVPKK